MDKGVSLIEAYIPSHLEEQLEFTKIKDFCAHYCLGEGARNEILNSVFSINKEEIKLELKRVEALSWIISKTQIPLSHYDPVLEEIRLIEIIDYIPNKEVFLRIRKMVKNIQAIHHFFRAMDIDAYPELFSFVKQIPDHKLILQKFTSIFDEHEEVLDTASDALLLIRQEMRTRTSEMYKTFRKIVDHYRKLAFLGEGDESIKNGRYVLSVLAEHKRNVKGIVHDQSDSGRIVYIEPQVLVDLHNEIVGLEADERAELRKIFHKLADFLRESSDEMKLSYHSLVHFDCLLAKARFGLDIIGIRPELKESGINIVNGRHPVLYLHNKSKNKPVVPFSLYLNIKERILVLSGPNAGGKSITMKSVGLFQLMLQHAYLLPVDKGSSFQFFQKIFADIGDQQSLEDELSTYSAKLQSMNRFMEAADDQTLVLIDEFGSGTEPKIGGAIAEAVLNELNSKQVFGIINTHYSNLKTFAFKNEGLINGAMIFDDAHLQPTYQLKVGKPGSSYALEIATKNRFPNKVLEYAKKKSGISQVALDELLADLDQQRIQLQKDTQEYKEKKLHVDKLIYNYDFLLRQLELKRLKLKMDIKQQDISHTDAQRKELDKLVKELRKEKNLDRITFITEETKRKQGVKLEEFQMVKSKWVDLVNGKSKDEEIKVGHHVKILFNNMVGKVVDMSKKLLSVQTDHMVIKVKPNEVILVSNPLNINPTVSIKTESISKTTNFNATLDIRGFRVQEAMDTLDVFLDKALIANSKSIKILHGKGNGILKNHVNKTLRGYKFITKQWHPASEEGGDGITLAELG
ncbi:MAG: Smr/MutS family protein [Bacteroidota bacterium]|nr:Smr/MutS family protein [Bacteroidota bacterium]